VGDGDQRHVRLFAKGETQAKRLMGGQVTDEKIGNRLAVFLRFLVLGVQRGNVVGVLAELQGYERSFNKASQVNWGTKATPAPTLNLVEKADGVCVGYSSHRYPAWPTKFSNDLRNNLLDLTTAM